VIFFENPHHGALPNAPSKEQLHKLSDTARKHVEMVRHRAPQEERTNGMEIELLP
jgi:hypothetical protein